MFSSGVSAVPKQNNNQVLSLPTGNRLHDTLWGDHSVRLGQSWHNKFLPWSGQDFSSDIPCGQLKVQVWIPPRCIEDTFETRPFRPHSGVVCAAWCDHILSAVCAHILYTLASLRDRLLNWHQMTWRGRSHKTGWMDYTPSDLHVVHCNLNYMFGVRVNVSCRCLCAQFPTIELLTATSPHSLNKSHNLKGCLVRRNQTRFRKWLVHILHHPYLLVNSAFNAIH